MPDNISITPGSGVPIASDEIGGVQYQRVKVTVGVDGSATDVSNLNPMPVSGPITNTELRSTPVPVTMSGTQSVTGPLTNTELRAAPVSITEGSGTAVTGATLPAGGAGITGWLSAIWSRLGSALTVTGPLTNTELRATAVPVSGPLTNTELRASALNVNVVSGGGGGGGTGGLTNTELRATPVSITEGAGVAITGATIPTGGVGITGWLSAIWSRLGSGLAVTGVLTNTELRASALTVTGPLTNTELRASALAVSESAGAPINGATMPTGGVGMTGWLSAIWTRLGAGVTVSATALPLPTGAATQATLAEIKSQGDTAISLVTGFTGINVNGQPMTEANPLPTIRAQTTVLFTPVTAVANTSATLLVAAAGRRGCRIVNYLSSPIYIVKGNSGDPAMGAGSDYVPPAYNGEPGQFTFTDYRPTDDFRYITAASGAFTVITW